MRSLQALSLRRSGCQQASVTASSACCALQTHLMDALAGLAQLAGSASRALTTASDHRPCSLRAGCGCSACAAKRRPRSDPGPPAAGRSDAHAHDGSVSRRRLPAEVAGLETPWCASKRLRSSAADSDRRFSAAAAASNAFSKDISRKPGRGMARARVGLAGQNRRTYSTVEEHQAEVRRLRERKIEFSSEPQFCSVGDLSGLSRLRL
jgi:hypothetical protein